MVLLRLQMVLSVKSCPLFRLNGRQVSLLAVEELARERFEERGYVLVRIGKARSAPCCCGPTRRFRRSSATGRTARVDDDQMKRPPEAAVVSEVADELGEALLIVRTHAASVARARS